MASYNKVNPQVRNRVLALARQGVRPALIHRELAGTIAMSSVYTILQTARRRGEPILTFPRTRMKRSERGGILVHVAIWKDDQCRSLERAAKARDVSPSRLVNLIVETVLAEVNIDGLLDDGVVSDAG